MNLALGLLLIGGALEVLVGLRPIWRAKTILAVILFAANASLSVVLLLRSGAHLAIDLIVLLSLYRLFNLYRVVHSRIQTEHLRRITQASAARLVFAQAGIALAELLISHFQLLGSDRWNLLASIDVLIGAVVLGSVMRNIKVTQAISRIEPLVDSKLPTLSVLIAARNETESLDECLSSLLACDYPKIEILVLDDQSTNRRTPEIIRSFAHAGVIFIPGQPFGNEWLAKNWAYQKLLQASNGDIVLFCGADTRFSLDSLRFLSATLVNRNKQIISVLPQNLLPEHTSQRILQPLRYWWEIGLPRRFINRPPILSTCWMARANFLKESGEFKAVSRRISPESYFAHLATKTDGYSFFQYPGIISAKSVSEQYETALRLRYPQLHRQPETVGLVAIFESLGSLAAFGMLVVAAFYGSWLLLATAALACLLFSISFGLIVGTTYRKQILSSYLLWPLALLVDLWLIHISMWRYEFGTVLWKGRSIAPSVMSHTLSDASSPHLTH